MATQSPRYASLWVLAAWTFFVWVSRVRNIAVDDELVGSDRIIRFALSGGFVALGAVVIAGLILARSQSELPAWTKTAGLVLAFYGIATWVFRGVDIAIGDHSLGFIIVHLVLGVITIGLSLWALRSLKYSWRKPSDARITA